MSKSVLLSYIIIADDTRIKKRSKKIKNRLKKTHKSTILSGANSQATELSSATGRREAQSIPEVLRARSCTEIANTEREHEEDGSRS